MFKYLMTVFMLVLCGSANADCESEQTQLGLNRCSDNERQVLELKLSQRVELYQTLIQDQQRALFNQSQADWSEYEKSFCEFSVSNLLGGSLYPFAFNNCHSLKYQQRLTELELIFNCEEGDLTCF